MRHVGPEGVLLALDAGVRETGWAILSPEAEAITGVISTAGRRGLQAPDRLAHLTDGLDRLVAQWDPNEVAHSQPSGIHWPVPALEMLAAALQRWSNEHSLPVFPYSVQEVRTAISGHPNPSKDKLAFDVMASLGLIGQAKTPHEWEAIAVGYYHLSQR